MGEASCPFCHPAPERLFYQGRLVVGLWDAFPVSPGHALLVPRRHLASWWDAGPDEQAELVSAIAAARAAILERHRPDGFNIGVNVGEAAGQTIFHLHVHVIPRYRGDVPDPRGGVRHVIAARAVYPSSASEEAASLSRGGPETIRLPGQAEPTRPEAPFWSDGAALPHGGALIRGEDDPLLPHLVAHLSTALQVDIAVAFTLESGVNRLYEHLRDVLVRGGSVRFLTGDYLDVTEPAALRRLLDLGLETRVLQKHGAIEPGGFIGDPSVRSVTTGLAEAGAGSSRCEARPLDLRVFETTGPDADASPLLSFHPKAYIFRRADGSGVAFVGSSNLTNLALSHGLEWNYRVVSSRDASGFRDVTCAFERLFSHPATRPLSAEWVSDYEARRRAELAPWPPGDGVRETVTEVREIPKPNVVQAEALEKLVETRASGYKAGLVVLATGLGKTWLAAFDSHRPEYRRILFVAHREEILAQAMKTFRRIRPDASFGHYTGTDKAPDADILFASIQTLGRNHHLERFAPDSFDYIVVDEFHHACARSYRRLIDHFRPKFLLGLTATPERTDGGDLLALCQENLVYRRDLLDGIRLGLLCPFRYFGVPDEVDYANIPWRNSRFEEEALTAAVATRTRAANAFEQYRKHAGGRTLAFCVSQRHADFMAGFFREAGVRAAAVHSGDTSAPRAASLEQLAAGGLDIIFAVDMFNEGVDLPTLDTVMMLRPTESRIVWLQQFGRGLRTAPGKDALTVVDYIGNHRTFLLKPQTLFNLEPDRQHVLNLLERLRAGTADLPPGCEVTYELEAVNILRALATTGTVGAFAALRQRYEDFRELHGVRPTASEMYHEGYDPRAVRRGKEYRSWLRFVDAMGDLDEPRRAAVGRYGEFLDWLEVTPMTKSYKMLTLLAMLNADRFPGEIDIADLVEGFKELASRDRRLSTDCGDALTSDAALRRMIETDPIPAWTGGKGTGGTPFFVYEDGRFRTVFDVPPALREAFQELTREIADWRLAGYLARPRTGEDEAADASSICKVANLRGRLVVRLLESEHDSDHAVAGHAENQSARGQAGEPATSVVPSPGPAQTRFPSGWTPIFVEGEPYDGNFARDTLEVVRRHGQEGNDLPDILRDWFGEDTGLPGTNHRVVLEHRAGAWHMSPTGKRRNQLRLWQFYSRSEIPALFDLEFSAAIWNSGFVTVPGHVFLLVTLRKQGRDERFQYADRFLGPDKFQWQSQNRTAQASKHGQEIRHHADLGIAVHLFVRQSARIPGGGAAPFLYCGEVEFVSWRGERPITVEWKLREPLPEAARHLLLAGDTMASPPRRARR